uniref:DUF6700 domain-containing protein n=1 Tax=Meloidogyne hapla TaxID=6305 RepID=A0A1I8B7M8_MELHA
MSFVYFQHLPLIQCVDSGSVYKLRLPRLKIGHLPLIQYILPIIEPYFLENAPNRIALADQALNLFTAILKRVPWHKYVKILTNVVIATLDAFHFDLRDLKQLQGKNNSQISIAEENPLYSTRQCKKQQIFSFISGKILPKLRELLRPQTQFNIHRRAQKYTANFFQYEDEKLLRAPLVLATARLFKWFPQPVVDQNMNGYCLLTLNNLLMSRSISVRQGARKLMISLVRILGPSQFPNVVRELKQTMNKGYQICKWEAFGNNQLEEHDSSNKDGQTQQLRSESHGIPEAKTSNNKTVETLTQIGRFIGSEKSLDEIVLEHIREIVEAVPKAETIRKLSDWLRALSAGLRNNAGGIPPLQQLHFSLLLSRKSMRYMDEDKERLNNTHFAEDKSSLRPPSCLLLTKEPKRIGVIHRIAIKSKMHIFVEFALQILVDQLKGRPITLEIENGNYIEQGKIYGFDDKPNQNKEFIPLLEEFIPILFEALKKKYDKMTSLSLRSIFYLFKWPLESLNSRLPELVNQLFIILNDYASLGQSANNPTIIELHQNLFKCFTHLLRTAPITSLYSDRLQLLLNYVETDILDQQKQTTAFNLVKAIINMKIDDEKITNIIEYLSEKAITSPSTNIRSQCRQVILLYLINHPQGMRNYEHWMEFFLNQTEYDIVDGRLSALEIVNSILSEFTEEANDRYAMLVFLKLAARLQNDDNEQCLQFIVICLRKLFTSITASSFNDLHTATKDWLSARNPSIRILAWRLFTQFVLSNTSHFTKHLLLEIVRKTYNEFCIEPVRFSSDVSTDCKLSFCELLQAITERNPEELFNGIFEFDDLETKKLKSKRKMKTLKKRKSEQINEEIEGVNYRNSNFSLNFMNFIENLEFCLQAVVQHNKPNESSERLKLSIAAASFLNTWIGHQNIRDKLIYLLNNNSNGQRTNVDEMVNELPSKTVNKLYSLCFCLISLLENYRGKDKELKNKTIKSEENNLIKDEVENINLEGNCKKKEMQLDKEETNEIRIEFWNDTLADLVIRLLTHFMLALDISKKFGIICKRLSKICWTEAIKDERKTKKRLCIFKMVGVLILKCNTDSEQFEYLCNCFLPLLYREINNSSKISEEKSIVDLQMLSSEIGNLFRKQLGDKKFSIQLAKCQDEKTKRKQKRREQDKALLILNPSTAIAVKQKRHLRKRTTKMRKMDETKPYRAFKRRREEAIRKIESEEF